MKLLAQANPALEAARQNLNLAGTGSTSGKGLALYQIVNNVVNVILGLVGMIIFIYFFYGGYLWMTAGGDSKKVDEAKTMIKNATIGLIIVLAAYSISFFVLDALIKATSTAAGTP